MKAPLPLVLFVACAAISAKAQIVTVTPNALTTGGVLTSTMPGSPNDYIVFNSGDYLNFAPPFGQPGVPTNVSTPEPGYNQLSSFFIAGGLAGSTYGTSIVSPAGTPLTSVGDLAASSSFAAFAVRPGSETANDNQNGGNGDNSIAPVGLNPNFNYNDFNVYAFFSDLNGAAIDTSIGLDIRTNGSLSFVPTDRITVLDDNTTSGEIKYVEFNVQGLGASLTAGNNTDLVVSMNSANGISYVNGLSFESVSVPEPTTYAMLGLGLASLVFFARRKLA